jgi:acrylyl-CoA reductase (NADPH)
MPFRAVVLTKDPEAPAPHVAITTLDDADLMQGEVTLRVSHSTVNYKDGLAITGRAPVVRRWPMIPGIDAAGVIEASDHPDWHPGEAVLLNGWGTGETHLGHWAQRARVKADWLLRIPAGLNAAQAMAVGTAGYTAALCVLALERHGLRPDAGPALVTGAAGGVGSVAIALLKAAGWHVIASTGRAEEAEYLRALGAAEVIDRAELSAPGRPLAKERWAAAIDSVGSHTLANVLAGTRYGGAVAACGLAQGMDLPASVAPFILRGVALLGIDSVMAPRPARQAAWDRIAAALDPAVLARMTTTVSLEGAIETARRIVDGGVRGRVVVETTLIESDPGEENCRDAI